MNDSYAEVVSAVARIPIDRRNGESDLDVLRRSGYLTHRAAVNADRLHHEFEMDSSLVEAWETWIESDRSVPRWYFRAVEGSFEVVRVDRSGRPTERLYFESRQRACAEYVARELELLAGVSDAWARCDSRIGC